MQKFLFFTFSAIEIRCLAESVKYLRRVWNFTYISCSVNFPLGRKGKNLYSSLDSRRDSQAPSKDVVYLLVNLFGLKPYQNNRFQKNS